MFVVFECVDLADMLSLWCCNPVTNSVLYLLVGIWFLASVALNYNHFFMTLCFSVSSGAGGGKNVRKIINSKIYWQPGFVSMISSCTV